MSLAHCDHCDRIYDTDEEVEGCYDEEGNDREGFMCDHCFYEENGQ